MLRPNETVSDNPSAEFITNAPEQTEALGQALARIISQGTVLALQGELATGKTCLVRGMARELASNASVSSPTFTLVNEYGQNPTLYHLDLYRLNGPDELANLGFEELVRPDSLCVIEWAERAAGYLPEPHIHIDLQHIASDTRKLTITPHGLLAPGWERILRNALPL